VVVDYGTVRNAIASLRDRVFLYVVLDEGHLIKSKKTKTTEAVLQLRAEHRLILSGTPIQNNVTELWSLMDFLMPGFLGSQEVFNKRFHHPIERMFKQNATEKETNDGQAALLSLHQQVLPFIIRRLKADVLDQLPAKVIYDEVFEMTEAQREVFNVIRGHTKLPDGDVDASSFTKMKEERDLCIHPCLLSRFKVPRDLALSAKLKQLRTLLISRLGFGGGDGTMRDRVLMFAQSYQTIELVRDLVLKSIDGLSFDTYDGSLPESQRRQILDDFKREDGKDILLLTTKIGGLGLDLPVANTVIFIENSWNPKEDDQAMDRAHRIGQRRQVTVFNLVTADTIEARIMETQKSKRKVIDAIINDENVGLQAMDTTGMIDEVGGLNQVQPQPSASRKVSTAEMIKALGDLHTEDQYREDFEDAEWRPKG
jgi:TATA-binding protein-associated factor